MSGTQQMLSKCSSPNTKAHAALKTAWVVKVLSRGSKQAGHEPSLSSLSSFSSKRGTHWPEARMLTDAEGGQPNASLPRGVSKKPDAEFSL